MNYISPGFRRGALSAAILLACIAPGCRKSDVVAKVGSHDIRRAELVQFSRSRKGELEASLPALVERSLLAEGARKKGLADDPEVRARVAAAEREALAQALLDEATAADTTDQALRKRYEAEKERLVRKRIHVAHLFLRAPARSNDQAAREKADRLYAKAVKGTPFADLARSSSEDAATAARGGDLGPLEQGQVDAAFFDAASKLKADEVSRPIRTAFGFHIVKALEAPSMSVPPFEAVRGQLAAEAVRESTDRVLSELRSDIPVKTHLDRIAARTDR
jgi:peptidyl-prolyl cis-trans isomerase C